MTIVLNLKIRKVCPPPPIRTWRKKTGPRLSRLIAQAISANTGANRTRPIVASTMSIVRLKSADERDKCSDGMPSKGIPSSVWICELGLTRSNSRGTTSICTSKS